VGEAETTERGNLMNKMNKVCLDCLNYYKKRVKKEKKFLTIKQRSKKQEVKYKRKS
jgi:hypothetical protein